MIIITEFGIGSEDSETTTHAMAGAILTYRRGLKQLERALGFASIGAQFGVLGPGPGWSRRSVDDDAVPPAA